MKSATGNARRLMHIAANCQACAPSLPREPSPGGHGHCSATRDDSIRPDSLLLAVPDSRVAEAIDDFRAPSRNTGVPSDGLRRLEGAGPAERRNPSSLRIVLADSGSSWLRTANSDPRERPAMNGHSQAAASRKIQLRYMEIAGMQFSLLQGCRLYQVKLKIGPSSDGSYRQRR